MDSAIHGVRSRVASIFDANQFPGLPVAAFRQQDDNQSVFVDLNLHPEANSGYPLDWLNFNQSAEFTKDLARQKKRSLS